MPSNSNLGNFLSLCQGRIPFHLCFSPSFASALFHLRRLRFPAHAACITIFEGEKKIYEAANKQRYLSECCFPEYSCLTYICWQKQRAASFFYPRASSRSTSSQHEHTTGHLIRAAAKVCTLKYTCKQSQKHSDDLLAFKNVMD